MIQAVVVLVLFFVSGSVGLALEVLWIRMLTNIFGTTVLAVSTVISSFFAGLALGAYLLGKIADRVKNPLLVYGLLELGVGVFALVTRYVFLEMDAVWATLYSALGQNSVLYPLSRLLLCLAILVIPTTLMGGTLPVLSKYFVKNLRSLGCRIGLIYSINTFGALLGCFLMGFVVMAKLGVKNSLYATVACSLLVALSALVLSLKYREPEGETTEAGYKAPQSMVTQNGRLHARTAWLVLIAFALSGFASLSYELLWTRTLVYFVGVQTYAYTLMLMAFLFGIASGSMVFAHITDKVKNNLFLFGVVEILIGISSVAALYAMGYVSVVLDILRSSGFMKSWWHYIGAKFIFSVLVMFLPTFLIGSTFPIVSKIFVDQIKHISRRIGDIYAINTVGGILGSIITGFLLLPLLGVKRSILLITLISLSLGLALIFAANEQRRLFRRLTRAIGFASFAPIVYFGATDQPIINDWNILRNNSKYEILCTEEGVECTLSVLFNKKGNKLELNINGQSTAYTSYRDIQVHKMLVHVPMLMHKDPRSVLIVGFGMGCTSYGATLYQQANVTCVELVKDETKIADYFRGVNHDVLKNPRFRFVHDDGRNHLLLTDEKYDVISFNAIHPRLSPGLYTKDFYEICRKKLNDGGVICAWLPTNWITASEFRSLVGTFISVFPQSTFWYCNPDHVLLVGTLAEPVIDLDVWKQKMARPEIFEHLQEENLGDPFSLIGTLILGPRGLKAYAGDARHVTDDQSLIEFSQCLYDGMNDEAWIPIVSMRESYLGELMDIVETSNEGDTILLLRNLKSLEPFIKANLLSDLKYNDYRPALKEYRKAQALAPQNTNIAYWMLESEIIARAQQQRAQVKHTPLSASSVAD